MSSMIKKESQSGIYKVQQAAQQAEQQTKEQQTKEQQTQLALVMILQDKELLKKVSKALLQTVQQCLNQGIGSAYDLVNQQKDLEREQRFGVSAQTQENYQFAVMAH